MTTGGTWVVIGGGTAVAVAESLDVGNGPMQKICDMNLSNPGFREDAAILAASKKMAAALRKVIPADFDDHPQDFGPEWHEARAALAEAEGETR